MSGSALNCGSAWLNPTSDTPPTCIVSTCTWLSCNTRSLSLWTLFLIFLKVLYVRGLLGFRYFENRLSICLFCFDSWSIGRGAAPHRGTVLLETITPTCLSVGWNNPLVPSSVSLVCSAAVECLKYTDRLQYATNGPSNKVHPGAGQPPASCHYAPNSFIFSPTRLVIWLDLNDVSSLAQTLIPKSACNTASGAQNHNLSCWINSGTTFTRVNLSFLHTLSEDGQISGLAAPQFINSGPAHLIRRHGSISADARWRAVVIGGTIGSTAGAVILGIGIYLLIRARRKQRTANILPGIESQPTELQAPRSSPPANLNYGPRSRSPLPRDAPIPTSEATPPTSSRPQQTLLHPQDIGHASHIRASTGSQFTEHFDDVRSMRAHPSETAANNQSLPPIPFQPTASTSSQRGGEPTTPIQHGASTTQFSTTPLNTSDMTSSSGATNVSPSLPPGAAAPVSSVGAFSPVEGSSTSNGRIQLS